MPSLFAAVYLALQQQNFAPFDETSGPQNRFLRFCLGFFSCSSVVTHGRCTSDVLGCEMGEESLSSNRIVVAPAFDLSDCRCL
jgi:hypothetical protein